MAVNRTNSNGFPMTLGGVSAQSPVPPATANAATPRGTIPRTIIAPVQVMGLVPVFPCCECKDAIGMLSWLASPILASVMNITVNTTTFAYTMNAGDSAATVQNDINASLPSGFTCIVNIVNYGNYLAVNVTINSPSGSCTTYNGAECSLEEISGFDVFHYKNFSGGLTYSNPNCDCREGKYYADAVPNDQQITLPAFALPGSLVGSYSNDYNLWVFQYPGNYNAITSGDFTLQEYSNGSWSSIATLNNSTYGTPYKSTCYNSINYSGYTIDWTKVYNAFGEGTYRFHVAGSYSPSFPYCLSSPAFCLKLWDCLLADGTVRFDANYSGGNFGSVTQQGTSWTLCCQTRQGSSSMQPIVLHDSLRYYGFFGYKAFDYERNSIKYQTGVVNKIRDEAIKKFVLKLGAGQDKNWPDWMISRFATYGLMCDKLYANDYNTNNPSYEYKNFWVVADGGVAPDYKGSSRYMKVKEIMFKEGQQYVFRDRCC